MVNTEFYDIYTKQRVGLMMTFIISKNNLTKGDNKKARLISSEKLQDLTLLMYIISTTHNM